MVENYITPDNIQCFRSPVDFVSWFSHKLKEINSGNGVREQILLRKGIAKVVFEEVYPLYRLLQNKGDEWSEIKFRNVVGKQPFDVETTSEKQIVPHFIEITVADMNSAEHLRMRSLADLGWVLFPGRNEKAELVKRGLKVRVARKVEKDYPEDTGLLIYFDDYIAFSDFDYTKLMSSFIASLGNDWMGTFSHLFVVGATGSKVWSRKRGEQGVTCNVAPAQ